MINRGYFEMNHVRIMFKVCEVPERNRLDVMGEDLEHEIRFLGNP